MMDHPLGPEHFDEPIFAHLRRDFVSLHDGLTIGQTLARLRSQPLGEKIVYFYVVDADDRLVGVVPTRRLLMGEPSVPIASIMVRNVVTLPTWATVREACDLFISRKLLAFPVVDAAGRLHGIADISLFTRELADLASRQSADDAFQLIGIHLTPDLGPWAGFKDRFPWLLSNVSGGLLCAFVTSRYESLLDAVVVLALFIPVVLALAESVSIQSVTLTLQRLHGPGSAARKRSLAKELTTAALLGLGCGGLVGIVAGVWHGNVVLTGTITIAIALSMVTASALGVLLPSMLRTMRRDPSIAAGPIVLALADLATLLFYFNLAGLLLG
jgi:magnesium transporter